MNENLKMNYLVFALMFYLVFFFMVKRHFFISIPLVI